MIDGGKVRLSELGLCCENVEKSNGGGTFWDLSTTVLLKDEFKCRHPKTVGHDSVAYAWTHRAIMGAAFSERIVDSQVP